MIGDCRLEWLESLGFSDPWDWFRNKTLQQSTIHVSVNMQSSRGVCNIQWNYHPWDFLGFFTGHCVFLFESEWFSKIIPMHMEVKPTIESNNGNPTFWMIKDSQNLRKKESTFWNPLCFFKWSTKGVTGANQGIFAYGSYGTPGGRKPSASASRQSVSETPWRSPTTQPLWDILVANETYPLGMAPSQ